MPTSTPGAEFEQEWAAALEESRRTFSLAHLYEVVQAWQARIAGPGGDPEQALVNGPQPYAVRLSAQAAKVFTALPEEVEQMAWDLLDGAAGAPWGYPQWGTADPEGEDIRIASVGQLSVVHFANRALRRLSVLDIVWLG